MNLQAIMKSFVASTSGSAKPDKFLAYMVPSVGEVSYFLSGFFFIVLINYIFLSHSEFY